MIGTRTDLDPIVTVRWPFAEQPVEPCGRPGVSGDRHRGACREVDAAAAGHQADQRISAVADDLEGADGKHAAANETAGACLPAGRRHRRRRRHPAAVPDLGPLAAPQHGQVSLVDRADVLAGSAVDGAVPLAVDGVQTVGTLVPRNPILALGPPDAVLACGSVELVAALAAGKPILALGPLDPVVTAAAVDPVAAAPGR